MEAFDPDVLVPAGSHRTLAERAFDVLHRAIITGALAPGERLPIEELARILGMSAMPVREALRRLHSVGLVENIPHRGASVTELTPEDLLDICRARLVLEPLAIRQGAASFSSEAAAKAQAELDAYKRALKAKDDPSALEIHTRFHFTLYEAAQSRWLIRLIRPLWESSERYRLAIPRTATRRRMSEHDRILAACVERQPDVAAAELHNHLVRTANSVAQNMGADKLFELVDVPDVASSTAR